MLKKSVLVCLSLLMWAGLVRAEPLEQQRVFYQGYSGYNTFRIPALYETANGVLLAFAEGRKNSSSDTGDIDTVLRRSLDGGDTWGTMQVVWSDGSNTCGNPTVLQDPSNGRIWLFNTHNLGQDTQSEIAGGTSDGVRTIWSCYSDDDGATWSAPVNRFSEVQNSNTRWDATGPGRGIVLANTPYVGRLVIPAIGRNIQSDDHGLTWSQSGFLPSGSSESQIVELPSGYLLRNDRNVSWKSTYSRIFCWSYNQGLSWSPLVIAYDLLTPICQASTIGLPSYEGDDGQVLVFSNPSSTTRDHMTIQYSYDNGDTWPVDKLIHVGPSGYSCLSGIGDEHLGLLYERGSSRYYENIYFAKCRRKWVTEATVFRWDFEEFTVPQTLASGSDIYDSKGYGYDGELLGSTAVVASVIDARPAMALHFAGSSGQGIALDDGDTQDMLDLAVGESMTVKVVFRTSSHSSGGTTDSGGLVSKDVGPDSASWWSRVQDGNVRFFMDDGLGNAVSLWSTSTVTDNEWHELRVVYDPAAGLAYLYIDGVLEDSVADTMAGAVANSNDVVVGKFNAATRYYEGDIALVEISKAALHSDQCGDWGYNPMDLSRDCYVDITDFIILMSGWLECSAPSDLNCVRY